MFLYSLINFNTVPLFKIDSILMILPLKWLKTIMWLRGRIPPTCGQTNQWERERGGKANNYEKYVDSTKQHRVDDNGRQIGGPKGPDTGKVNIRNKKSLTNPRFKIKKTNLLFLDITANVRPHTMVRICLKLTEADISSAYCHLLTREWALKRSGTDCNRNRA